MDDEISGTLWAATIIAFIVLIVLWKVYWKIWHWSPSAGAVLTICGVMAAFLTTRK